MRISSIKLGFLFLNRVINILLFGSHGYAGTDESDELPCDGDDDGDLNCPIDTWVFGLVVLLIIIAIYHQWKRKNEPRLMV